MVFRSNILKGCTILHFKLNGIILNVVDTYKYLGHYINDIDRQRRTLFVQGDIA